MAKANLNENYDNKTDFEDGFSMCYQLACELTHGLMGLVSVSNSLCEPDSDPLDFLEYSNNRFP